MKLFEKFKIPKSIRAGKKINSTIAFIFAILALSSTPFIFFNIRWMALTLGLAVITFYELCRGLQSKSPKYAKVALVLLFITAVIAVILCLFGIITNGIGIIQYFGGGANG